MSHTEPKPAPTPVSPKVIAGTIGAGVGVAIVTLTEYVIDLFTGVDLPDPVTGALTVLVSAGLAWAGGYAATDPLRQP